MARPTLVLASASPRRRQLLGGLGIPVEIRPARIDESAVGGRAAERVLELARRKAATVAARLDEGYVLAADTLGEHDGQVLGKPVGEQDAMRMLWRMSERVHDVLTGVVALKVAAGEVAERAEEVVVTRVHFQSLTLRDIQSYLATGEYEDKAGAYAIQGEGRRLVRQVEGSYTNVVGLPLPATLRLLGQIGYPTPDVDVAALDVDPAAPTESPQQARRP